MTIINHIEEQVLRMDDSRSCRDTLVLHHIKNLAFIMGLVHQMRRGKS